MSSTAEQPLPLSSTVPYDPKLIVAALIELSREYKLVNEIFTDYKALSRETLFLLGNDYGEAEIDKVASKIGRMWFPSAYVVVGQSGTGFPHRFDLDELVREVLVQFSFKGIVE